jgi:hypothetical protein
VPMARGEGPGRTGPGGRREAIMPVAEETSVIWVVLDPSSEVLLMCSGADAPALVEEWRERGYRTLQLPADEVDAA